MVLTNVESFSIYAEGMQKERVKLFNMCHSKMEEIVPENSSVRYSLNLMNLCNGFDDSMVTF